jgi:hypothetical protein
MPRVFANDEILRLRAQNDTRSRAQHAEGHDSRTGFCERE